MSELKLLEDTKFKCKSCGRIFAKRGRFGRCPNCSNDMEEVSIVEGAMVDESTGGLYIVETRGNPETRRVINDKKYPNRYVMVFREMAFVKELTCPHCGKRGITNSYTVGRFDYFCNAAHHGQKCGTLTTYVFERRESWQTM